ncbi:MAG: N-acetylmuramoyl-L-alanine amidase [Desulfotalea sp.]
MIRICFIILISLFCCSLPTSVIADEFDVENLSTVSHSQQYINAKKYLKTLQKVKISASNRDNWLIGTRNFRRLYLISPKGEYAPKCLFLLGKMYAEMYNIFSKSPDLKESLSYYNDVISIFPQNYLADDSYYAQAELFLKKNEKDRAKATYLKVIEKYPHGDMVKASKKKLQSFEKIAVPVAPPDTNATISKDNPYSSLNNPKKTEAQSSTNQTILSPKFWNSEEYCRISIMTSGPVKYSDKLDSKSKKTLNILFNNSQITKLSKVKTDNGLLKSISSKQIDKDKVLVKLNFNSISNYKIFSLPDPFRIIIDIQGNKNVTDDKKHIPILVLGDESDLDNSDLNVPLITANNKKRLLSSGVTLIRKRELKRFYIPGTNQNLTLAQQLGLGIKHIVIDPGHGGKDPGAMAGGLKEKDLVLQLAKKLVPLLEKKLGCKVSLTRDRDIFIPLEQRTAIANTKGADLFISLHINAHNKTSVKGIETYFLNLSTNPEAMRVAARENAISSNQMSDLQDILSSIMNNSKINESERLAGHVHGSIVRKTSRSTAFNPMRNLGVKQAPFYVLIGAQMPSILIEVGFITNSKDRRNLKNNKFLNTVCNQIVTGVKLYSNSNKL